MPMLQNLKTRELLIKHYQTYPAMQIRDIFKFIYQSAFGCEHMVSSEDYATEYILCEYDSISHTGDTLTEELDGDYCRVHLSFLDKGLSAKTLGKLFFLSAKKEENGNENLIKKLNTAHELVKEGLLPFDANEFEKEVNDWVSAGCPSVHHSEKFRQHYSPSYRVISRRFVPFIPLFSKIDSMMKNGRVILAVEGSSASGKSTLGNMLCEIYGCTILHTDDFFLRPEQRTPERYAEAGGNLDRERFLEEVLIPLSRNCVIDYRRFDCSGFKILPAVQITPKRLTVIEGTYSMHPEFSDYYNLSVFLDISHELQKNRILKRNSPDMAKMFFDKWIPLEKVYFEKMNVKERCDVVIK